MMEQNNLQQTADLLIATLAYNSNYPRVYQYNEGDYRKLTKINFRQALIPTSEEEIVNALENMFEKGYQLFLEKLGLGILDEPTIDKLKCNLRLKIMEYGNNYETIKGFCEKRNNVLIMYPEEKIDEYMKSEKKEILEYGKEFSESLSNEIFFQRMGQFSKLNGPTKILKTV